MNGWIRRKRPASAVLMLALAACTSLHAGAADDTATADEAFLLFLADWETARGDWQDPLEFDGPGWTDTEHKQVNDDDTTDLSH
jgi:hypothetical protein